MRKETSCKSRKCRESHIGKSKEKYAETQTNQTDRY